VISAVGYYWSFFFCSVLLVSSLVLVVLDQSSKRD
jgi:hypothetical protein